MHMGKLVLVVALMVHAILALRPHEDARNHFSGMDSSFQIGTGIHDITGPAAEEGMMGYALPGQNTAGIHFRLWSRAFVFVDSKGTRGVYVSNDVCMTFQSIKIGVVEGLQKIFGATMYTHDNVMISGIHTHSGPGGFSWYTLYDISDYGFSEQNYNAIVNGTIQAIVKAHNNVKPSKMMINYGHLNESNISRSPTAYLANPASERAQYPDGDTDKNITTVRIEDAAGKDVGAITWFAVHCTSMNNTNHLISGDNKGRASMLFEKHISGQFDRMGSGKFVAAFGQSNEGDVSPNTMGARCPNGKFCDSDSTCDGHNEHCIAPGPGKDMVESTDIIGTNQFKKALELYTNANIEISGSIMYRHMWIEMTNYTVTANFTHDKKVGKTCRPAMGYSFAAGTTDGPGAFDFRQGNNNTNGNLFWNFVSSFLAKPNADQIACQAPKPILIDVGEIKPNPWVPSIVPVQIMTIGRLVLLAVPGEFTTMSGRRLRNTVRKVLEDGGFKDPIVIVSGLTNTYTGYIATYEEYTVQRYEGASTIYGPHTLAAYQQAFSQLATSIITGKPVPPGPLPIDRSHSQMNFNTPVVLDTGSFGKVEKDVSASYKIGDEVQVIFWGANPRNNLMIMSSFLSVEMENQSGGWTVMFTDSDWETTYRWARSGVSESLITIEWSIPSGTPAGKYRIRHNGYAKESAISDKRTPYEGVSSTFTVSS